MAVSREECQEWLKEQGVIIRRTKFFDKGIQINELDGKRFYHYHQLSIVENELVFSRVLARKETT